MHVAPYLFFSFVALVLFFMGLYDWGLTKQKIAVFPSLVSAFLSIILFGASWNLKSISGGIELSTLSNAEAYSLAMIWALFALVSLLLSINILLETPGKLNAKY